MNDESGSSLDSACRNWGERRAWGWRTRRRPTSARSISRESPVVNPSQPSVLDAQALQRLRDLDPSGQNRLLERVLRAFEASVARLSPQLQEARRRGDMQSIRHVVHTLKSSSASIGALVLSRLCAEIEAGIRQEAFARLPDLLDGVDGELEVVLQALKRQLGMPT
jgi:HPt (histidine-containing phosphotransfer) domain-containing protein